MSGVTRVAAAALIGAALVGLGCGDSNAPGGGPTTLLRVAGDSQSGVVGAALPTPLRVRVMGSASQPSRNVTVSWTVTQGTATLGAPSSQTDTLGYASTTLTLGGVVERIAIQAAVASLQPVTFTATACGFPAFTVPDTVAAAFRRATDCRLGGYYTDFYSLDLTSGQQGVTIAMSSDSLDSWLELYTSAGSIIALHDDIDPGVIQNSLIHAIVAPGNYVIAPSSFDADTVGPYTLSVVSRSQSLTGCEDVWVTRGVTVTDSVTAADCVDGSGKFYADGVAIVAFAGSVLTIAERSTAFDAQVGLYRDVNDGLGTLQFVAANDDSAGIGPDSYLVVTAPFTARYVVFAATADSFATGAYTLAISASATAAGAGAVAPAVPSVLSVTPFGRPGKLGPLPRSRRFR